MVGRTRYYWVLLHGVSFLAFNITQLALNNADYLLNTNTFILIAPPLLGPSNSAWQVVTQYAFTAWSSLLRYGALRDALLPFTASSHEVRG
jgi:hypothetical protein